LFFTPLKSEDKIDIWNNKDKKQKTNVQEVTDEKNLQKLNLDSIKKIELNQNIKIEDSSLNNNSTQSKVFGIYDPAENDFNLNMWSSTKAEDIQAALKRIEKINLSKTSKQILEKILFSISYSPEGITAEKFTDLKINWLIKNQRSELIESFLKKNENLKVRVRQYNIL